ncbi:MAG: hypothetical protein QOE27_719 [Solirubrobacteraceae bacterium]|nr:hypothetical protein [Solirubrobacteraceae bacterium]
MGRADSVSNPALTLSRRRLAFIGVAAVFALAAGFLAAKFAGPGRGAASAGSTPARTTPAAAAPSASTPAATTPAPSVAAPGATTPASPGPVAPAPSPSASAAPVAPSAATATLPTSLPTVTLSVPKAGFSLTYPRAWTRLPSHDPTVSLLLSSHDGVSLLVRGAQLRQPIDGPRLATLRDLTGQVIRRHQGATIIAGPRLVAIHNLPGFLYIYSFFDALSHQRVAHSHIVLFNGRRMYTLVFQTARASDLPRFAMLFDKISTSFRPV